MYTRIDFRTKKALRDALTAGRTVEVFQPGPFGSDAPINGTVTLEGPHYPEPHRWYARAIVRASVVVKVLN